MTRRRVSNPLALAVLGCLTERPMHPYEISTTLRTRGKEKSIKLNYGSLYSVVESPAEARADHGARDDPRGPAPRAHRLRDHRRPASRSSRTGSPSCCPRRAATSPRSRPACRLMPGLPPDEVARLLDDRAAGSASSCAPWTPSSPRREAMKLPELFVVESTYRRHMLQAELELRHRARRGHPHIGSFPGTKTWRTVHELVAGRHVVRGDHAPTRSATSARRALRLKPQ